MARNRHLLTDYSKSDAYLALLRGAIYYMGVDHIDLLGLGLPVSTYVQHKAGLADRVIGVHQCGPRSVEVRRVRVYPQPLGGFFDYSVRSRLFAQMSNETNLLIDPGYFTLDWLMTQGIKTIDARSGAANDGGMGSILRTIAKAIAQDLKVDESELGEVGRIDAALRGEAKLRLFGELVNVEKYRVMGVAKAEEAINSMMHTIGRTGDIVNIVLVGGGSHFYLEPIMDRFPKHKIAVAHDPVFANVRGFQLIGEQQAGRIVAARQLAG
jgi:plasmid segregation protein ParM